MGESKCRCSCQPNGDDRQASTRFSSSDFRCSSWTGDGSGCGLILDAAALLVLSERVGQVVPPPNGQLHGAEPIVKGFWGPTVTARLARDAGSVAVATCPVRGRAQPQVGPNTPTRPCGARKIAPPRGTPSPPRQLAQTSRIKHAHVGPTRRAWTTAPAVKPLPRGEVEPRHRLANSRVATVGLHKAVVTTAGGAGALPTPPPRVITRVVPAEQLQPELARPLLVRVALLTARPGEAATAVPAAAQSPARSLWTAILLEPATKPPEVASVLHARLPIAVRDPCDTGGATRWREGASAALLAPARVPP